MTYSTVLQKYNKRLVVEIEVWVSHRSESNIMHISDPSDKEWRACVRHSDGKMEWEWCKTFDDAVAWCERYSPNAPADLTAVADTVRPIVGCSHNWEESVDSQFSNETSADVKCTKCGMIGEKTIATGEVFFPAT